MAESLAECKGCTGVCMSVGLCLVLEYLSATSETEQPKTRGPQPVPQHSKKEAGGSTPPRQKHTRHQLRENQIGHFYKCLFCQEVFPSRYDRNTHQKGHQEKENRQEYRCPWKRCSRSFETELSLWKHQRTMGHHSWTECCWRCKTLFPNFKSQMAHIKSKRCVTGKTIF